jgi:hypothetical protein
MQTNHRSRLPRSYREARAEGLRPSDALGYARAVSDPDHIYFVDFTGQDHDDSFGPFRAFAVNIETDEIVDACGGYGEYGSDHLDTATTMRAIADVSYDHVQ